MSVADCYLYKAQECARRADASTDVRKRTALNEEAEIWRGIQRVLGTESEKVYQNGIFDSWYLYSRYGLITRGTVSDTMIAHSVMFPELPKSLAFLGSIYCGSQAYWKDLVKFDELKEEA